MGRQVSATAADELRDAIQGLYDTFARYKLAPQIPGYPFGSSDADNAAIHSAPLRQLTADNLSRYAFKAMTTWGSVDDFRHLLPRVFELLATGQFGSSVDSEVVLGKLVYGEWRTWPAAQQEAVERFLLACWRSVLGVYPHPLDPDALLCAIGQSVDDLSTYLVAWDVAGSKSAACHFADFIGHNHAHASRKLKRWHLGNAFWSNRPVPAEQVRAWLLHPDRVRELEQAFYSSANANTETGTDAETAALLSEAFNELSRLRLFASVN